MRTKAIYLWGCLFALSLFLSPQLWAQVGTRQVVPVPRDNTSQLNNTNAPFLITVALNNRDHVYYEGDKVELVVVSEEAGFVYLLNILPPSPDGQCRVSVIFPNPWDPGNRILARTPFAIPTQQSGSELVVKPPFGKEEFAVIVSRNPLPPETFGMQRFDSSVGRARWGDCWWVSC
jgi:hypothetical protein